MSWFNATFFAARAEDPRMVWLKDQYLFLYFQDDLCMGPLAADAIKASYTTLRANLLYFLRNLNFIVLQLEGWLNMA